ncbi:acyl-CoA dehydrogenase [Salipiger sp. IMCC34102]|uniref:acyl-CoA dehydrogenase n=1 Tax=Salipiger sp. IMCC34102 TaxID=2510647 RepID=UPI0010F1B1DB|nr:acyl-CoA dehydrogenase [Salipiger sp. IMCC34102]RYH00818.1 acyl-CoA dehydrogenase [Salipiger sp. IMCC34102]
MLDNDHPVDLGRFLVALAEANLPLARLCEGHVNARQLVELHAPGSAPAGAILGVWGADGDPPVTFSDAVLSGRKRYASGLGIVTDALVTVLHDGACRLALVDVTDPARHHTETWDMLGMRATVSGDVDLAGLTPTWIGDAGAYHIEPSFVGGVWRIAALQLGGTFGLIDAARDYLSGLNRLDTEAQISRLTPLLGRSLAAFGLIEKAAQVAQGPSGTRDPERAVALSIQARLLTEELAQDTIATVEKSVGLAHFARGSDTGRIARDLATYCRQVARDAMEQRSGRILLARKGPLSDVWHG